MEPSTISAPGSAFRTVITAEASRTTLVTLNLGALFVYLVGKQHIARNVLCKKRLHLREKLVPCLDVKPGFIFYDEHGIAGRDVSALTCFGGKCDATRCSPPRFIPCVINRIITRRIKAGGNLRSQLSEFLINLSRLLLVLCLGGAKVGPAVFVALSSSMWA
jgi:hypothetical protein